MKKVLKKYSINEKLKHAKAMALKMYNRSDKDKNYQIQKDPQYHYYTAYSDGITGHYSADMMKKNKSYNAGVMRAKKDINTAFNKKI